MKWEESKMGAEALNLHEDIKLYTYEDYTKLKLKDGERFELIDGVLYAMAAPNVPHQRISRNLVRLFGNLLEGKPCEVFHAPFDVCLNAKGDKDKDVFQPDLFVVCDKKKLEDGKRCNGAPDLVIEILSPTSSSRDYVLKLNKYRMAGVREYWIVDPEKKVVQKMVLQNKQYIIKAYLEEDVIPVKVLSNYEIELKKVFAEE